MNVVISGASKGIGKGIALAFAQLGHNVAICARNEKALKLAKKEINAIDKGGRCISFVCDVSIKVEIKQFASFVLANFDSIDILINNAGFFLPGKLLEEDETNFENMMHTNIFSAYYLTKALLPKMIAKKDGYIFNICSVASLQAYENGSSYSISKFALLGFSKSLREELKTHQIRVTAVMPGATLTDSWSGVEIPEERFMSVEDVAQSIVDCSQLSKRTVVEELVLRPMLGDI